MSDHWIILVPQDTGFVPRVKDQTAALRAFEAFAPEAEGVSIVLYDTIEFFDCGESFETVACPNCRALIDIDWWGARMSQDYGAGLKAQIIRLSSRVFGGARGGRTKEAGGAKQGFRLRAYKLMCCRHRARLDELVYVGPQAFGRFGLSGMNCGIGQMSQAQIAEFQVLLKCDLTAVYRHL